MILLVGLLVAEALGQFGFMYAANWLGQSIIKDIRIELYDRLRPSDSGFMINTHWTIGNIVVSDIETISQIFSQGILVIFGDLFRSQ